MYSHSVHTVHTRAHEYILIKTGKLRNDIFMNFLTAEKISLLKSKAINAKLGTLGPGPARAAQSLVLV
jgi:hypothetical protein